MIVVEIPWHVSICGFRLMSSQREQQGVSPGPPKEQSLLDKQSVNHLPFFRAESLNKSKVHQAPKR